MEVEKRVLERWAKPFLKKRVIVDDGIYRGLKGQFVGISGWEPDVGCICQIQLFGIRDYCELPSCEFTFVNEYIQQEWDRDD